MNIKELIVHAAEQSNPQSVYERSFWDHIEQLAREYDRCHRNVRMKLEYIEDRVRVLRIQLDKNELHVTQLDDSFNRMHEIENRMIQIRHELTRLTKNAVDISF